MTKRAVTYHQGEECPVCPHCRETMYDFRPRWDCISRERFGRNEIIVTATGDCPECGRPVEVREYSSPHEMTGHTTAKMTETDFLYLHLTSGAA